MSRSISTELKSDSDSQLLGFQINPLSHSPLSISSLHSHQHLFLFKRCLLLQILAPNLPLHLHDSCHSMCLTSLVFYIRLNTLTTAFFTTSLNLLKSAGTGTNLSMSNFSTSVFKLSKFVFNAKLEVST